MANEQNLTPVKPGQILNPNGRPKGSLNRKTILNYLLFEANIDEMGVLKSKPIWYDTVKPKTMYEMMTMAMAIKAMSGDTSSFNAINSALGLEVTGESLVNVVHIFKPEKLSVDDFNNAGAELLAHTHEVVEGEVVDGGVESTTGTADISITNP